MNYSIYDYRTGIVLHQAETWLEINEIFDNMPKEVQMWCKLK